MNWLFRRHFWIVHLVFLSIVSAITAKTFSTLIGYWALKSIPERPVAKKAGPKLDETVLKNFDVANERNLFSARRENISVEEEEMDVNPGRWQDAGPSSLSLKLLSTAVFFDPFQSRAEVTDLSTGKVGIFSIGTCQPYIKKNNREIETVLPPEAWEPDRPCNVIFGMAEVKRIEEYRVVILNLNNGKYEYLSLLENDRGPMRARRPIEMSEDEGNGVRKKSETSYDIDQKEFDKALANFTRLMTEARAVPEHDNSGATIGFKLVYVKEGSLFEKIGLKTMDVLTRINGFDLNSAEKALQLYSNLKSAKKFTIDLKRSDQSMQLDYSVVR